MINAQAETKGQISAHLFDGINGELLRSHESGITAVSALDGDVASKKLCVAAEVLAADLNVIAREIPADPNWTFHLKEGLHFTVCSMVDPLKKQALPRLTERKKKFFELCVQAAKLTARLVDLQPFEVTLDRAVLANAGVVIFVGGCSNPEVLSEFRELVGLLTGSWRYFDDCGRANGDVWVNIGRFTNEEPDAVFPRAYVERAVTELNPLKIALKTERLEVVEFRDRGLAPSALRRRASLTLSARVR